VRRAGGIGLALLALAFAPAAASAAKLVTWRTESRHVDASRVQFNGPPPGGPTLSPALRVNVLLPDGFSREGRYPVLYLLHGHGDRFDYWANPRRGNVRKVADGFAGIIVMPEGARGWYANWWNGGRRGEPGWERYHLGELIALVERRLPIRRGRRWHAIAGLSMGGEGATFYASQRPGYFGSAAAFSAPLSLQRPEWPAAFDTQGESHQDVFGDPEAQEFYWAGHNPTALVPNLRHTRLYVTVGDGAPDPTVQSEVDNVVGQLAELELRQHAGDFVAAARQAGVDITYVPRQGIHDWRYWREHLAAAIRWGFFRRTPQRPGAWSFRTVADRGSAWGLRFRFAPAPDTLERLSLNDGRELHGQGGGWVRIWTPSGCRFTLHVPDPWRLMLPRGWRRRSSAVRSRSWERAVVDARCAGRRGARRAHSAPGPARRGP
jgi:S-formylglutathione hydrolase FrmB